MRVQHSCASFLQHWKQRFVFDLRDSPSNSLKLRLSLPTHVGAAHIKGFRTGTSLAQILAQISFAQILCKCHIQNICSQEKTKLAQIFGCRGKMQNSVKPMKPIAHPRTGKPREPTCRLKLWHGCASKREINARPPCLGSSSTGNYTSLRFSWGRTLDF